MTFLEVSKAAYDYSWKASNIICDSVGVGCWCTPKEIENETDRYAYQRFIDDRRNSRTDKKLYNMAGFINWGDDGIPHYFLSSESFKSLDKHLKEMQKVYAEKGWDYDLPVLDSEEFGNFGDIDYTYIEGAKSREDHIKKLEDTLVKAVNMLEHSDELYGYQLVDLKKEAEGLGIDPHRLWTFIEKK